MLTGRLATSSGTLAVRVARRREPWRRCRRRVRRVSLALTVALQAACGALQEGNDGDAEPSALPARVVTLAGSASASASRLHPILAGAISGKDQFPATGAICYSSGPVNSASPSIGAVICTGTLIAPDVVLAAGHCQEFGEHDSYAGLHYFFTLQSDLSRFGPHVRAFPGDAVQVARFVPHPDYGADKPIRHRQHVADLALLFLAEPIHSVAPAELLPLTQVASLEAGRAVTVVGYGRRSLHFAGVGDGGVKSYGLSTLRRVDSFELQVGTTPADAFKCWGDSGGPTFLAAPMGGLHLIGVTSRAADAGGCRNGGIDTRVDAYRAWIDGRMAQACDSGERPACSPAWRSLPMTPSLAAGHPAF